MKHFFEQYGGVTLGILALLVLIAMITPVGNIIKTSLQGTVETFSSGVNNQANDSIRSSAIAMSKAMNKGSAGYLLSDGIIKSLKDSYDIWHKDNTVVYYLLRSDHNGVIILQENYSKPLINGKATIDDYRIDGSGMHYLDDREDWHRGSFVRKHDFYYDTDGYKTETDNITQVFYDVMIYKKINGVVEVDSCETVNIGCEVN